MKEIINGYNIWNVHKSPRRPCDWIIHDTGYLAKLEPDETLSHDEPVYSDTINSDSGRRRRWRGSRSVVFSRKWLNCSVLPSVGRVLISKVVHVMVFSREVLIDIVSAGIKAVAIEAHGQRLHLLMMRIRRRLMTYWAGELRLWRWGERNVGWNHRYRPLLIVANWAILLIVGCSPNPGTAFPIWK